MNDITISTPDAPGAIGPYAQARKIGDFLFTSGQLGMNPETGALETGVEAQTVRALENLGAILRAAGMSHANIVKTTVFVKDMNDFAAVNKVYAGFFTGTYPARSCVEVARLPKDGLVEIECVAAK